LLTENISGLPFISVVVPVYNNAAFIGKCIEGIRASRYDNYEIIIVDDASSDNTVEIVEKFDVNLIKLKKRESANYCRNIGADEAKGDILLFMDSDVVVEPETLGEVAKIFSEGKLDAIVGVYSVSDDYENLISRYKNLWIRYSYIISDASVDWIFGAISAIKKNVFLQVKGFNRDLHSQNGTDDLELGKRLASENYAIEINEKIEGKHLRHFTLGALLKNDFRRSRWFVALAKDFNGIKNSLKEGFVNIYPKFILSTALSIPMLLLLVGSLFYCAAAAAFLGLFLVFLFLNFPFVKYFSKHYGAIYTPVIYLVIFLDNLASAFGSFFGLVKVLFKR